MPPRPYRRLLGLDGSDFDRILALSDGGFAFALTLLALSLTVPVIDTTGLTNRQVSSTLAHRLQEDYNAFFGYIFAFVMIGVWWVIHNRTFRYIEKYDSTRVWLNLLMLLQIAILPFVMSVYSSYGSTTVAVDLFAGIQVSLGLTSVTLWDYSRHRRLRTKDLDPDIARYFRRRGWLPSAVFALSIGVSFVRVRWAPYRWIGVFVVQRFFAGYKS
ncbi:MAG: TMEM175 family protein [Thermoplasmata archaeon]